MEAMGFVHYELLSLDHSYDYVPAQAARFDWTLKIHKAGWINSLAGEVSLYDEGAGSGCLCVSLLPSFYVHMYGALD